MLRLPVPVRERPAIPAWLASVILHAVLIVLLPLLLVAPAGVRVTEKRVAIVLAQAPGDAAPKYLDAAEQAAAVAVEPSAEAALPAAESVATLVPDALRLERALPAVPGRDGALPGLRVSGSQRVPGQIDGAQIEAERTALQAAAAARGSTTRLGLFGGATAEGRSFVFLIDRSKSMGNQGLNALEAAERELLRAVAGLQPVHRFQVIAYHDKCIYLNARHMLPATDENKQAIRGHLTGLAAFGATEHELGLRAALYLEPDALFLLTDGGDPKLSDAQLRALRKLAAGRTSIHCIQFGHGPARESDNFLHRLATQNGGSYGYVDVSAAR